MIRELTEYLRGWVNYFGFCERRTDLRDLDGWIRRRLRCAVWKQWQTGRRRYRELRRRGVNAERAKAVAGSSRGPWPMSRTVAMSQALSNRYLDVPGSSHSGDLVESLTSRTAVYGPVRTVVWEGREPRGSPPIPISLGAGAVCQPQDRLIPARA